MADVASHEWTKLQKIVRKAAEEAVRKWPGVIDKEDVEQDVMLILAESPATVRGILDADDALAHRLAVKLCHREAAQEMTDYDHFTGQFTYDTEMVKALLEHGVLTWDVQGFSDELVDLMDALERMAWEKSPYVDPILRRYVDGEKPGPTDSAAKMKLSRAVESLTQHMNRTRRTRNENRADGPGTRKVVSNSAAAYLARRGGAW